MKYEFYSIKYTHESEGIQYLDHEQRILRFYSYLYRDYYNNNEEYLIPLIHDTLESEYIIDFAKLGESTNTFNKIIIFFDPYIKKFGIMGIFDSHLQ